MSYKVYTVKHSRFGCDFCGRKGISISIYEDADTILHACDDCAKREGLEE